MRQTADGGYIVAGKPRSTDGDVSGHHGGYFDFWVVKLDAAGSIVWQKCLGGRGDIARAIQQTADGGYLVAGSTQSTNGDVSGVHGRSRIHPGRRLGGEARRHGRPCLAEVPRRIQFRVGLCRAPDRRWRIRHRRGDVLVRRRRRGDSRGEYGCLGGETRRRSRAPHDEAARRRHTRDGYETPIVVRDDDQVGPFINGSRVVWQDWRNGGRAEGDIYSYDLASHLELPESASSPTMVNSSPTITTPRSRAPASLGLRRPVRCRHQQRGPGPDPRGGDHQRHAGGPPATG